MEYTIDADRTVDRRPHDRLVRLPFEPPSQSAWIVDSTNRVTGHISLAGPILKMPVGGKLINFEMHRYFGPIPLRNDGEVRGRIPRGFWDAFEAWTRIGKPLLGNVCCVE